MFEYLQKKHKGFTLIETFVAITIIAVSIVAPITLARLGVRSVSIARDQMTAYYLAVEALEYVQHVRHTNRMRLGPSWFSSGIADNYELDNCIDALGSTRHCYVDIESSSQPPLCGVLGASSHSDCPLMEFDPSDNSYGYTSGTDTIFRRSINIVETTVDEEAIVTARVSWNYGPLQRSVELREILKDWSR